jgi:hypothetical protein
MHFLRKNSIKIEKILEKKLGDGITSGDDDGVPH